MSYTLKETEVKVKSGTKHTEANKELIRNRMLELTPKAPRKTKPFLIQIPANETKSGNVEFVIVESGITKFAAERGLCRNRLRDSADNKPGREYHKGYRAWYYTTYNR